jgi:tetratricopeptide (TPR) repeat protein
MSWKPELDAIIGARHGGRTDHVLGLLEKLDARFPHVAEIVFQRAWTLDSLDRLAEALPLYDHAVALGLSPNELSAALLGLGTTLTRLGHTARAIEVLTSARLQFPENREFDAFLALAFHAAGRHTEATQLLITVLADTSDDFGITAYQRTLRFHAAQLTPTKRL